MRVMRSMLSLALLVGATIFLMNCGDSGGSGKSDEETQLDKLKGTWTLTSADLDGTDRTDDFPDLVLTISGTFNGAGGTYTYSFTGTRPDLSPWPASGTWEFGADPKSQITRIDDNQEINYTVSGSSLTLDMNYQGPGFAGGRTKEVTGNWSFSFSK